MDFVDNFGPLYTFKSLMVTSLGSLYGGTIHSIIYIQSGAGSRDRSGPKLQSFLLHMLQRSTEHRGIWDE